VSNRLGLIPAAQSALLSTALFAAALTSRASDWQPVLLVVVLLALAVASDVMIVEMKGLRVSGAFFSVVLAMVLLGPAPAAAIGLGATLVYAVVSRRSPVKLLNDAAVWSFFPVVGGLLFDVLGGHRTVAVWFCAVVVVVYMTTNILNFLLVALY